MNFCIQGFFFLEKKRKENRAYKKMWILVEPPYLLILVDVNFQYCKIHY